MELSFVDAKDFVKEGQPVLTVRQPYALFLVNGSKEYEFRSTDLPRKYFFNEWILIHAGAQLKKRACRSERGILQLPSAAGQRE